MLKNKTWAGALMLAAVALLLVALASGGARGRGTLIATFAENEDAHVITPAAQAGDVSVLNVTSAFPEVLEGKLSGPFTEEFRVLVLPDGSARASGTFTCDCTYADRRGTVEIHVVQRAAPGFESAEGEWVAIGRSGDLRGLWGSGTLEEEHGSGKVLGQLVVE
jgi:hypothetical protein